MNTRELKYSHGILNFLDDSTLLIYRTIGRYQLNQTKQIKKPYTTKIQFTISNTGSYIDKESHERTFQIFQQFTTSTSGFINDDIFNNTWNLYRKTMSHSVIYPSVLY